MARLCRHPGRGPPLLTLAGYLLVEVAALDPAGLLERQRQLVRRHPQVRLIARNADTLETLKACRSLAFSLFQGTCVTHRRAWREPRLDGNRMVVAQLTAQLRQDPEDLGQVALPEGISQLGLPEAAIDALLRREGLYVDLLALAIACEEGDRDSIARLADRLGLTSAVVSVRHLEALAWAVELTDDMRAGL